MLRILLTVVLLTTAAAGANAQGYQGYRGMPVGWPAAGYAPAYAATPYVAARPVYGAPALTYQTARPAYVATTAGYAPTVGMAPSYAQTAYGAPTTAYYAPQPVAGYAAGYGGVTAYSPVAAAAPAYGLAPPAGATIDPRAIYGTAGAFSLPQPVTYYRPNYAYYAPAPYAAAPMTYYRPVTAYQVGAVQPTTCLQPVAVAPTCGSGCGSSCGSQNCGIFSWLFGKGCGSSCGSSCGQSCTTAYCGQACGSACGAQPYYPVVPVNPIPTTNPVIIQPGVIPYAPAPAVGPRVPAPPTRILPSTGGVTSGIPADVPPSLAPGAYRSTTPGSTFVPSTPAPSGTIVAPPTGGAFPSTVPGTTSPLTPRPTTDYYPPSSSAPPSSTPPSRFEDDVPSSSFRFTPPANATPSGVRIVPDPDASTTRPANRAPQLIDPRDRSAAAVDRSGRWAVVPAVWPKTASRAALVTAQTSAVPGRVIGSEPADQPRASQRAAYVTPISETSIDDGGWSSAR